MGIYPYNVSIQLLYFLVFIEGFFVIYQPSQSACRMAISFIWITQKHNFACIVDSQVFQALYCRVKVRQKMDQNYP